MRRSVRAVSLAVAVSFGLALSSGVAQASDGAIVKEQATTASFNEDWGSADVSATLHDGSIDVEATNVQSKDGCLKLKYKVDRRTTYLPPIDAPEIQID